MSFALAARLDAVGGPRLAFLAGAATAAGAFTIGVIVMPAAPPRHANAPAPGSLLDFRPVFANRAAMAWIIGYTVHTWELAALRAWAVTFLTVAVARNGAPEWLPAPAVMFTVAGLAGVALSVSGNELSQRFGRYRVVLLAMGWGLGFGHLAVVTLGGLVAVRYLPGVSSGAPSPGAGISS